MSDNSSSSFSSYIEVLPKITNYVVVLTLLCYISGFAIANMYLGTLGIVNLDVLRTRYILVGFLFLLFLGAIAYLIYGLFRAISKDIQEPTSKLIKNVFLYSLQNLGVLYLAVSAMTVLAGSVSTLPVGLPRISQPTPWLDWLNVVPKQTLISSAVLLAIFLLSITLVVSILILINPKNKYGIKESRKQQVVEILSGTKKNVPKTIGGIFIIFLFIYVFLLSFTLLSLLSTNNLAGNTRSSNFLSAGWGRYLGGISLVYILVLTYVLAKVIPIKSGKHEVELLSDNPMTPASSKLYLLAMSIIIIMPLYANGIYPSLPQQVGGGQVVKIELKISDDEIEPSVLNPDDEVYLIDRTNDSTLFLLINNITEKYQVVEIPNSSIRSVIFKPSP